METWRIGDVEITRVVDVVTIHSPRMLVPEATAERLKPLHGWLAPHFLDEESGRMRLSIHAFAIRSGAARVVVDTCLGNGKQRSLPEWSDLTTSFLDDLGRCGFAPERVDRVLCTHLHFDHVGWNTRRDGDRWIPTFPNARYLVGEAEWAFWRDEDDPYAPEAKADSITPVFEAGLVDLVPAEHVVTDEVRLIPTPGHTPGHVSVAISSRGEEAIITGDLFHHPLQVAHPEWKNVADVDPDRAERTRRDFLARYADRPVLILGTHFASPTAGHIVTDGDRYRFAI